MWLAIDDKDLGLKVSRFWRRSEEPSGYFFASIRWCFGGKPSSGSMAVWVSIGGSSPLRPDGHFSAYWQTSRSGVCGMLYGGRHI